ncbi:MAG TPA: response regulator [Geothrix sp.]|nr:response regulator [Geothrix sp.]
MPRLLLVDDNPSIHRIAESLLAPTDIELICSDSAEDALDRLERGERFDVALLDTAMPGMDGWTLLARLRAMEATAHLPIALMAGVLDPVDPAKLAKAPIQGFLKKPIELRELGDRVKSLLTTPVVIATEPSPFSTVPATPVKDLIHSAESTLPEFRREPLPEIPESSGADLPSELALDVLVLGPEDLWPEEVEPPAALPAAAGPDVQLELEELDLESLQDLTEEPLPEPAPETAPELADLAFMEADFEPMPAIESMALPDQREEEAVASAHGPEDLDVLDAVVAEDTSFLTEPEPALAISQRPEPLEDDDSLEMLLDAPPVPAAGGQIHAAEGQPVAAVQPAEPVQSVEPVQSLAPTGTPAPKASGHPEAEAMLQALLAEPVLMDALVKALVARMGDQVLREIAWEVMPDLAGRLQR